MKHRLVGVRAFMPYRFDFDSANWIARCSLEGRVTEEDVRSCYRDAAEFFALTCPRAGVFDLTGVISLDFPSQTVYELAKLPPILTDPERVRVAIAPAAGVFGMARMFEMLGDSKRPNLHVVRTSREAWAILGIREPQFKPLDAAIT